MIKIINISFNIFIILIIFLIIFFITSLLLTRKYKNKYRNFYSIFLDLNKREAFLYGTLILNFLLIMYFLVNIESYYYIGIYMIAIVNIFSSMSAFNFYLAFLNIIYSFISIELLWLLNLINSYLTNMILDKNVLFLKRLLVFMIILYAIFITIRKLEIILKHHLKKYGGTYV